MCDKETPRERVPPFGTVGAYRGGGGPKLGPPAKIPSASVAAPKKPKRKAS